MRKSQKHLKHKSSKSKLRISTVDLGTEGVEVPKRRRSKFRRSRTASRKHSKIQSEVIGEWEDRRSRNGGLFYTKTGFLRERESISKLCSKIVENFWETAWDICSERFYHENAPATIAYELRDTWLRIIEANWLDQDIPQSEALPPIFTPDEPPEPLIIETPSTERFFAQRELTKKVHTDEHKPFGGSGEPQATEEMENNAKPPEVPHQHKANKTKPKTPMKSGKTPKKITTTTPGGKRGSGKYAGAAKAKHVKPKKPPVHQVEAPEVAEVAEESVTPQCIPPPPPPPPEIPVDVLYIAPNYKGDALTPTDSRVRTCGKVTTTVPSQELMNPDEEDEEEEEEAAESEMPDLPEGEVNSEGRKTKSGSIEDSGDRSGFTIKKAEVLEGSKPEGTTQPVNIVERIDNLLAADSDHVVDILKPTEVEQLHGTGSLTFKVGDGEFGEHFKGKLMKSGSKKETLKPHKVKAPNGPGRSEKPKVKSQDPKKQPNPTTTGKEERPMKLGQGNQLKRVVSTKAK